MSEVCWRSEAPIEATISEPVVGRVPWSERYSVLQCCGHAVLQSERGKKSEVEGRRGNVKFQSSNVKWLMSNDKGIRARTCSTNTNNGHGQRTRTRKSERRGIRATEQKHRSKRTMVFFSTKFGNSTSCVNCKRRTIAVKCNYCPPLRID